jgi:hypothetical protein
MQDLPLEILGEELIMKFGMKANMLMLLLVWRE